MGLTQFQATHGKQIVRPSWLTIKNGDTKKVVFLAEPHEFRIVIEHTSPDDWKKRAVCTYDAETDCGCFACEQKLYAWNQNIRVYIPCLVNGRPHVIAQGIGANSVFHDLVRHKRECGTIKHVIFEVSRKGEGKRSAYRAEPTETPAPLYKAQVDIDALLNNIEYANQKRYYKE